MGTTIDDVIEDANALMEHIKYWMDCSNTKTVAAQALVQRADELIEALCNTKEALKKVAE